MMLLQKLNQVFCKQRGVDWDGPLFIYLTAAVFVVPSVVTGVAYLKTAMVLWTSVRKAAELRGEHEGYFLMFMLIPYYTYQFIGT